MKKQLFSFRKYKVGLVSVAIGALFLLGQGQVAADSTSSSQELQKQEVTSHLEEPLVSPESGLGERLVQEEEKTLENGQVAPSEIAKAASASARPELAAHEELAKNKHEQAEQEEPKADQQETSSPDKKAATKPLNIDSNTMIHVPQTWDSGYKGEGRVIAIIDSGLDVEHDVLRITDPSKAKYQNQEELDKVKQAAGISYGKWFNDKVIFGYNYMDGNNQLKEKDPESHGMHVTGIAAGNPSLEDASGQKIFGVAPEAQVLFMRVFSDKRDYTDEPLYRRAIEDAIKLGADTINLSLGSTTGSLINGSQVLLEAIDKALKAGVTVVVAAGNDSAFGDGYDNPRVENPDYGLVGSPSTFKDVIAVASINNTTYVGEAITALDAEGKETKSTFTYGSSSKFDKDRSYDYVYVGLGKEEDYQDLDIKGKIALIKRGDLTFQEKVERAQAHGAIAALVFNNRPEEGNISMGIEGQAASLPSAFIPLDLGEQLLSASHQLVFDGSKTTGLNPEGGKMSSFSSWGLTSDGLLKPDITAPGGKIYSSVNDGAYANVSGTSMASPHIAGVAALIKEALIKSYPDRTAAERERLARHLLLSSAIPHFNEETGAFSSPRQQGGGVASTYGAIHAKVYVTAEDDSHSVNLGNIGDRFHFKLTLHNISDEDQTLSYVSNLVTDQVEEGRFSLKPRALEEIAGQPILVKAHSSKTINLSFDASAYQEELSQEMPNGYYLEGFVRFLNTVDQGHVASIPFVGFRGQFQDLAVLEKPVYEADPDKDELFYHVIPEDGHLTSFDNVTSLITDTSKLDPDTGKATPQQAKILGTFETKEGQFILHRDRDGQVSLALSPNQDGNQDSVYFRGVFLRNFENLRVSVYRADDVDHKNPLWRTKDAIKEDKNYFASEGPMSHLFLSTTWSGQDKLGQDLPDGSYHYVVSYYPVVPGAKKQEMVFPIVLDRQAPIITTAHFDAEIRTFTPRKSIEKGLAGLLKEEVYSYQEVVKTDDQGQSLTVKEKIVLAANPDGSYTLPQDQDLDTFYFGIEDKAGNRDQVKLSQLIELGNQTGRVKVRLIDKDSQKALRTTFSYVIKDDQGRVLDEIDKDAGDFNLPFGDYSLEMIAYDQNDFKLEGGLKHFFHLDADNSYVFIDYEGKTIERNSLTLAFNQELPSGTEVVVIAEDGDRQVLPAQRYGQFAYGKRIPTGSYKLELVLPNGLEVLDPDQTIQVQANEPTYLSLQLLDKRQLLTQLEQASQVLASHPYYNGTQEEKAAYDTALAQALAAKDQKVSQEEINRLLAQLVARQEALSGLKTNRQDLINLLADQSIKDNYRYFNASDATKAGYETALAAALTLNQEELVTQAQVDEKVATLKASLAALDGQKTDFSGLDKALKDSQATLSSAKYLRASKDKKAVYDQLLDQANSIDRTKTSQAETQQMLTSLEEAQKDLNGRASQRPPRYKIESHQIKYDVIYVYNPHLAAGKKRTIQHGSRGIRMEVIEMSQTGRRIINSWIALDPIPKIIEIGSHILTGHRYRP